MGAGSSADGSLIIDTGLDTTGFEKGSDKLESAIKNVVDGLNTINTTLTQGFQQTNLLLTTIAQASQRAGDAADQAATQTADANERMIASEQQAAQAAQQTAEAVEQQGQNMSALSTGATTAQNSMSALGREIASLASGIQSISASAENGFANGKAVLTFDSKLTAMEAKLASAKEKLDAFATTQIPTEEYSYLTAELAKAEGQLSQLQQRQSTLRDLGVKQNSQQWRRLANDIAVAQDNVSRLRTDIAAMESYGNAFITGAETEQYAQMRTSVEQTAASLERNRALIDSEAIAQARLNVQAAQEQVVRARTTAQREAAMANLRASQEALNALATSMSMKGGGQPSEAAISGWQRFSMILRTAAQNAMGVMGALARAPFNAIAAGLKKATSQMKKFNTRSKQTSLTTKDLVRGLTRLRTMLFSRVREMFITALFHGIRDNMKLLAQFSKEFDGSMSNIKNSMKGLSANLTVSLGGLLTAIEPMLTRIISAISRAISYLNAFFALLSGKSTVTVAKKQTDSYAASLGGAAGAAEELKRQVYGFDQLNKRSSDSDGGGGGSSAGDLYEEIPIDTLLPDSIKNWFDQIKAAFEAGDWYGVGTIISSGLSSSMTVVESWFTTTLAPLGRTWVTNIANLLNGLVDGFDWDGLGRTLGAGLNTAFSIFNTFLTTFDFMGFGAGVGGAINGAFASTDWSLIGQTLANKFNGAISFFYGVVQTTNWSQIGASLAAGVNGLGTTIDWSGLGATLGNGVKGAINAITTMLTGINWQQIGNNIATFLANIDWSGITTAISKGVGAAIGGLAALLWGLIEKAWDEVVGWWRDNAIEDGEFTMEGLLDGIWNGICDIGSWIKTNIFQPFIDGLKAAFGINSPSTVMQEQGGFIVDGLLLGIKNGWSAITSFFTTGLDKVKTTLSTGWTNIRTNASTSWQSIKTTISTAFDNARTSVSNGLSNMRSNLSTGWTNLRTQTSTAWSNIRSSVSTAVSNMQSSASSAMSNIRSSVSNGWNNLKSATTTAWSSISSTVTSKWNSLKSTLTNTNWYSVGSNLCSGIARGINAGWSWLSSTVSSLARNMLNKAKSVLGIRSPSRVFEEEVGQNIGLGMAKGISDTESDVLKTVSNLAQSTVDNFDANPLKVNLAGNTMVDGLDAVADRLTGIAATFRSITSMLTTIGGLAMPQIAAGSTVPTKTRVEAMDGSNMTVEGFDLFASDFDEYMADHGALLRKILEAILNMRLVVDADSLEKGITGAQKSTKLSFGGV